MFTGDNDYLKYQVKEENGEISMCEVLQSYIRQVESEQAKKAMSIADELSNLILFHKKVRENGTAMMEVWDE